MPRRSIHARRAAAAAFLALATLLTACGASSGVRETVAQRNAALLRGGSGEQAAGAPAAVAEPSGASAPADVSTPSGDGPSATTLTTIARAAAAAVRAPGAGGSSPARGSAAAGTPGAQGAAGAGPAASPGASGAGTATGGLAAPPPAAPSGGNGGATEIGVTGETIKVGGVFFNGSYLDKYSQVAENSAAAYFRYVNDQGGVYGRKFEYLTCDTAGTADGTQGCVRKLVNDNKVFTLGPTLDYNLDTVQPFVTQQKVPWVGSSGLYPAEFENPYVFPTQIRGVDVGALIATFARQQLKVETVGVSYLNDGAGPECTQRVEDVASKLGFRVVAKIANQQIEGDLTGKVIEMRSKNPDAVVFCNDPVNNVKFIQAAGRTGYKPPKGWVGGFVAADDVPAAIGEPGVGMYGFTAYDFYRSDTPGIRQYRQITETYYPNTFHHFYEQASYVGAVAIVEAVKQAGPQLTRAKFLEILRSWTDFDTGMGLRLNFADVKATKASGIMLQADANLRWQPASARYSLL